MLERRREDALPENRRYVDAGCEVSSTCLACPLERCRYDEPGAFAEFRRAARLARIRELRAEGLTGDAIADALGISRRTVFRDLQGER